MFPMVNRALYLLCIKLETVTVLYQFVAIIFSSKKFFSFANSFSVSPVGLLDYQLGAL